ncbi:MAG: DUF2147 domain-containing protein [Leptospiraceae bacterium]|nr:DUF2147 domain-containing protein [Leptospiraceae bacterium]
MSRNKIVLLTGSLLYLLSQPLFAADPDAYMGTWLTQDGDSKITLFRCGKDTNGDGKLDNACGKITWLKEPNYPAGDQEAGKPKHDRNNPNASKRSRPIQGMFLVWGFQWDGSKWAGGNIYNPTDGKTYSCFLDLQSANKLLVRGFVGVSFLGKTVYWSR